MTFDETDNSADVLDIRNLIARFEELESERESLKDTCDEADTDYNLASHGDGDTTGELSEAVREAYAALESWDEDNAEEFKEIGDFLEEMKGYGGDEQWRGDWYPVTLVRDSYWREYAQNYAEEVGDPDMADAGWPYNCIDWDKAARELQMDYSSGEYGGVTYWYR